MRISDWISDVCSSDLLGLLLGAVWSPCFGPTLGAASVLAAQGKDLGQVALVMIAFGIGAALPLLLLGLVSREVMMRWRDRLLRAGQGGRGGAVQLRPHRGRRLPRMAGGQEAARRRGPRAERNRVG